MTVLVVDGANVVGSRPDGWWRDRAGAADRLAARLGAAMRAGPAALGGVVGTRAGERGVERVVLVVEGAARAVADPVGGPEILRARADGDSAIVDVVAGLAGAGEVVVVTADRGLRARVEAAGGEVVGPGVLLRALDAI